MKEKLQPFSILPWILTNDVVDFTIDSAPYFGGLFGAGPNADLKNSNITALYLGTGSLGLPERDYYVGEDEDSEDKRAKYVTHTARMFGFLGESDADAMAIAKEIMAMETKMAESLMTKEESRNPLLRYNPKSIAELSKLSSSIDWAKYFDGIGAGSPEQIIVTQPNYIERLEELLNSEDLSTIKNYLRWHVLDGSASFLSDEIDEANFDFFGKTLRDLKVQKPRKERVLRTTNGVLGEALGKLYVAEYFPIEAKETAVKMVDNLIQAYDGRIKGLDWMSDTTKVMALEKLHGMRVKIGYPDKWKDYSDLEIKSATDGGTYLSNILSARAWNYENEMAKLGKDVDKDEWFMNPQTVNAYYNPLFNEIVFPAAILQEPFFDYKADAAVNYGGMGAVIGHEISHGFDDSGSRFDANGNLNNWWTDADLANFQERSKMLVAQYDAYEPLPGIHVNGEFTLGENIGDLGGLNAAYDGLKLHLAETGDPGLVDGYTPEQRLFINWATIWRTQFRDEALINQIKTDPHSPGLYRAIGPLGNIEGFYEAFGVSEGDEMFKADADRVKIW